MVDGSATGLFVLESAQGFGLTEPEKMQKLWARWLEIKKRAE
jgi:hypothetical protein